MIDVISNEEAQEIISGRKRASKQIEEPEESKLEKEDTTNKVLIPITELPSAFKGYPKGTKISYSPLTLGELKAVNSSTTEDVLRGIAMLINSIHCNTMKSEDLYYWDIMYIGIKRKLLAFGETEGIIYGICPTCHSVVEKKFKYTELEFLDIEAPDLPVITTLGGKEVEIAPISIKDFLQIEEGDTELSVYARMIKNLPYEEALDLVTNATGKDVKKLKLINKKLNYGISPFLVSCTAELEKKNKSGKIVKEPCGTMTRLEVRSPFEVVFPEDIDEGDIELEIQYGKV